jgi:hypothetical protein
MHYSTETFVCHLLFSEGPFSFSRRTLVHYVAFCLFYGLLGSCLENMSNNNTHFAVGSHAEFILSIIHTEVNPP